MPSRYPIGGRLQRLARGMGALSLGGIVNIVSQIVVVPAALYGWGELKYGEWLALTGLLAFLRLGDLGLQSHAVNRLCTAYARGDHADFERVLRGALGLHLASMALVWLGAAIVVWTVPLGEMLDFRTTSGLDLRLATIFLAVEVSSAIPAGLVTGLYRATGRLSRGAVFSAVQQALTVGLTIVLVLNATVFSILAGARLLLTVALYGWIIRDVRRLVPHVRLSPALADRGLVLSLLVPSLFFFLVALADYLSMKITLLAVQVGATGAVVSQFVTHRTVANFPRMWGNFLTWVVWPELTAVRAVEDADELRRLYRSTCRRSVLLVGLVTVALVPLLPWLYPLWTGGRLVLDPWAMAVFFAQTVLWSGWGVAMTLLLAIDHHRLVGPSLMLGAVLTAVGAVLLVPRWGTLGAAVAALGGDVVGPAWLLPLLAARRIDVPARQLFVDGMRVLGRFAVLPLACSLTSLALLDGALSIVVAAAAGWPLALWLLATNLSEDEKRALREGGSRILTRSRSDATGDGDTTGGAR